MFQIPDRDLAMQRMFSKSNIGLLQILLGTVGTLWLAAYANVSIVRLSFS